MAKSNKVEYQQHIDESVEYILQNKSGWTQYTQWAREKYDINNKMANQMWKDAWVILNDEFSDNIRESANKALLELEQIKLSAIEADDRRTWLDVVKYQAKIQGAEIERSVVEHKGNVTINVSFGE
jgi:hypothetical protein